MYYIHGVDHKHFRPYNANEARNYIFEKYKISERYILTVGTIEPRKNIESILENFAILMRKYAIKHQLVIAGRKGWKNKGVFQKLKSLGIERHVKLIGYVLYLDLPKLYSGAEVFIYPSLYEGFGFPLLEAMSCGVPCITSNVSSLPEIAADGAILVHPKDVNEIPEAAFRIITERKLATSLVERGLNRSRLFTWEKVASKFYNIISSLA